MDKIVINKPIVSVEWLYENLDKSNLVILDATIPKVGHSPADLNSGLGIKNAHFFDIKKVFSKKNVTFPNTIVTPDIFEQGVRNLGINNNDAIVVYDQHGVYSSPRARWMFKAMGHNNIAVLDGGLPAWKKASYPCEKIKNYNSQLGSFKASYQPKIICDYNDVLNAISDKNKLILDARSEDRFKGLKPEPREGLRSGHIPNSKNLPFTVLVDGEKMLSAVVLSEKFKEVNPLNTSIVFSCGSGITACILALGAEIAGYKELSVYDGSWTEWGSLPDLPIEK